MNSSKKLADLSVRWFWVGMAVILGVSALLRFWGLTRFNTLVFDEVYYVKFANNYLTQTPFFDGHPPLSKYILAVGIWLGMQMPFGQDTVNSMAGTALSTWSYRWLNALTGTLIPLVVAAIAYLLTRRRSYTLIATALFAADGLFLVESRYALNNVYLVISGLLGQVFFLLTLHLLYRQKSEKGVSLLPNATLFAAGLCFSIAFSIKWNGLWFLFGAYLTWGAAWVLQWFERRRGTAHTIPAHPLRCLTRIHLWQMAVFLGILPLFFYWLSWIPHLQLNVGSEFWDLQQQILAYHKRIGNGPDVHRYCANWYTWLLMLRPVAYFYERAASTRDPVPSGAPLPQGAEKYIYDVHAMGNPFLWWFALAGIVLLGVMLVQHGRDWFRNQPRSLTPEAEIEAQPLQTASFWVGSYLVLNYLANLLPWVGVTRCTFIYHYMGSLVFAVLALAVLVDRWLFSTQVRLRRMGLIALALVFLAFLFWMPIYLGLPLSILEFRLRMWFPSWV